MKLTKHMKEGLVRAIVADIPSPDSKTRRDALQAAIADCMSTDVRKVYDTAPKALATRYIGDAFRGLGYNERAIIVGDVPATKTDELIAPYKAEDAARNTVIANLTGAIESCSTLKQLNDRLPEFKKYYPTEAAPCASLPALANVVADLAKLGWPKGNK